MSEDKIEIEAGEAPATVTVEKKAEPFPGPYPGQPIAIHNHIPAPAHANGNATRVAMITGAAVVAVALITTFGGWMINAVAKVQDSVAEVHELTNSAMTELRAELAAANDTIAELSERIGGMVPAPPVEEPNP